ncbi:MAG: hypothetical protein CMM52_14685 [Rhodospirillaceae bacterium]|nr:hypothetical protein [Rhodospirillaceae bacterium]
MPKSDNVQILVEMALQNGLEWYEIMRFKALDSLDTRGVGTIFRPPLNGRGYFAVKYSLRPLFFAVLEHHVRSRKNWR